jgi:hypothetical protein
MQADGQRKAKGRICGPSSKLHTADEAGREGKESDEKGWRKHACQTSISSTFLACPPSCTVMSSTNIIFSTTRFAPTDPQPGLSKASLAHCLHAAGNQFARANRSPLFSLFSDMLSRALPVAGWTALCFSLM